MRITIPLFIIILLTTLVFPSCLAGSPTPIAQKFVEKCQTGDWSSAETLLSERGKLQYTEGTTLHDKFWPILGLAFAAGVDGQTIRKKMPEFVTVISSDSSTNTGQVRMMIKNSAIIDQSKAKSILDQTGLKSIDIAIKFDLIEETGRWKIEKISPQCDRIELVKWEELAKKTLSTG